MVSKSLWLQSAQTVGFLMIVMLVGLFIDSEFVAHTIFKNAQWVNNILVVVLFVFLYRSSPPRTKELLLYACLIAIIGEYVFSKLLGMYSYRLGNVPHYIPPGHAIVFLMIYNFCKQSKVRARRIAIQRFLTITIIILAIVFLILRDDVYGFILTMLVFFFLRKHPKEKLFYLTMFAFVVYTELIGTAFKCWQWPPIAFDQLSWLPSANPPLGISFFYFGLDRGVTSIYKRRHKGTWKRFLKIQKVKSS